MQTEYFIRKVHDTNYSGFVYKQEKIRYLLIKLEVYDNFHVYMNDCEIDSENIKKASPQLMLFLLMQDPFVYVKINYINPFSYRFLLVKKEPYQIMSGLPKYIEFDGEFNF